MSTEVGGSSITGLCPHGTHPCAQGFGGQQSPVIVWQPGKEGSRRNRLLCLAPIQEVSVLKVRAGWEAFPAGGPAHVWLCCMQQCPVPGAAAAQGMCGWSFPSVFQRERSCFAATLQNETLISSSFHPEGQKGCWELSG